MSDTVTDEEPLFSEGNRNFFLLGSGLMILVWLGINLIFSFLEGIISPETGTQKYYLLLSLASLIVSYLIGYVVYNHIMIGTRVQEKYDRIMKSLVVDAKGNRVFTGDTKKSFTRSEWLKLGIDKHLRLIEVSQISDNIKFKELEVILEGIDPKNNPLQYAETISWICKKLILIGDFEESKRFCIEALEYIGVDETHAEGIVRSSLGMALKKLGDSVESHKQFGLAIDLIPEGIDKLRWLAAKKDLLRLNFLLGESESLSDELEEIHEILKSLAKSNDGAAGGINSWRINSAMESYYDLYSMYLASIGEIQWATRYSFAATVLAESRTGHAESTFSMSHLTKHLMSSNDFKSAMNLLDDKRSYLEERGNGRAWVTYNLARCHYGLEEYDEAIENYLEAINSDLSSAEVLLTSHIGLHYAYKVKGNETDSQKHKHEAEKLADETGFIPVWVAPQVLKTGITHTEADINQFDWQISGRKISWSTAISIARNELGITGFKPIKKGTEFYDLAKKYYTNQ